MGDPIQPDPPDRQSEHPLPYAPPDPTPSLERRLSRFAGITLLIAFTLGLTVLVLWLRAWNYATTHKLRWFTHFSSAHGDMIALPSLIIPMSLALLLISRYRRNLFGPETLAAEKAEEKRLLAERISAFGWSVPRSAEAADWRKILLIALVFDIGTFILFFPFAALALFIDHTIPSHTTGPQDISPFKALPLCSNGVALAMLVLWLLMAFVLPRNRILLLPDGVGHSLTRRVIPYRLIQKVRVTPSPRHPKLQCIAILSTDEFGQHWRHYEFSPDAPLPQILATFASKGVPTEATPAPTPPPHPHGPTTPTDPPAHLMS